MMMRSGTPGNQSIQPGTSTLRSNGTPAWKRSMSRLIGPTVADPVVAPWASAFRCNRLTLRLKCESWSTENWITADAFISTSRAMELMRASNTSTIAPMNQPMAPPMKSRTASSQSGASMRLSSHCRRAEPEVTEVHELGRAQMQVERVDAGRELERHRCRDPAEAGRARLGPALDVGAELHAAVGVDHGVDEAGGDGGR